MRRQISRLAKGTLMLAAPPTWTASFVPMTVSYACIFLRNEQACSLTDLLWIFASYIAMALIETGKHAVNDFVDFRTGNDPSVDSEHITPFSGGKKALTSGILSEKEAVFIAFVTLGSAGVTGLAIVFFYAPQVLWFGIAGMIISVIYTLPPFKLCYRGWGELAIAVTYGPMIFLGAYFMFSTERLAVPSAMSLHLAFLITNVLVINEYPDYEADLAAGKMNLIARIGKARGLKWFAALFILSYVPIVFLTLYTQNPVWLLTVALIPMMRKACRNCKENCSDMKKLVLSNKLTIQIHTLAGVILILCMVLMRMI